MGNELRNEITKRNFSDQIEDDLIETLEKNQDRLKQIKKEFNEERTEERVEQFKRRFPLLQDQTEGVRKWEKYPNLDLFVLIVWHLEDRKNIFYRKLEKEVRQLEEFLENGENQAGERIFQFLLEDREIQKEEAKLKLNNFIKDLDAEISNYEDEADLYEERTVEEKGLLTNDAFKCLDDFKGRTLPFLRAISLQVKEGANVLEPGLGTGVFSYLSLLSGAEKVVGVELNPITCILAKIIRDYLADNNVIEMNSCEILWGNYLKFGSQEYSEYQRRFDLVICENIYTGMFFELQTDMISHTIQADLVPLEESTVKNKSEIVSVPVIPTALSSGIELVQLSEKNLQKPHEVLIDLEERGIEIEKKLSAVHPYDIIDFTEEDYPNIKSEIKLKVTESGRVDGIDIFSFVKLMDGEYIGRNENRFLNNDSILFLNEPIDVKQGDEVLLSIIYDSGDEVEDAILEIRRVNETDRIEKEYSARLNIPEDKHQSNKKRFLEENNLNSLNLTNIGDKEILRSSSFISGEEHLWMGDIGFKNTEDYSI